jgi:hypothetical protein
MCYSATSDHLGLQMLCRAFGDARCKIPGNHWLLLVMENSCKRLAAIILHFALGGQAIPRDQFIAMRRLRRASASGSAPS